MRILRLAVTAVFICMCGLFGITYYKAYISRDFTMPSITVPDGVLEVSTKDAEKVLLTGVTAYDEKDGDITEHLIVESISNFGTDGTCKVTYGVCDSDKHVATASRKIRYIDYTSPKFTLEEPLCFALNKRMRVGDIVGAVDAIDGDISADVIISSTDYESSTTGTFSLTAKVTNNRGETVQVKLPLIVEDREPSAPIITLKDYLIYVKPGKTVNYKSYIESVTDIKGNPLDAEVTIESNYVPTAEGVYSVHYYVKDAAERTGHTVLLIIVEGK